MNQPVNQFNRKEVLLAILVSSAVGAGAVGGGVFVHEQNEQHRYNIKNEIAIIEACRADRSGVSFGYEAQLRAQSRWDSCVCALQKTQKSYSWDDYRTKYRYFLTEFNAQHQQCLNSIR